MRSLPLYPSTKQPIDESERLQLTSSCTRCARHEEARTVCMQSDVTRRNNSHMGGVLVVGSAPTKAEDDAARPLSSKANDALRRTIEAATALPVAYTFALRCFKDLKKKATEKEVEACRPYLAQTLDVVKPERILCLGREAFMSVLGTDTPPENCRRGYGHLEDGTPVFLLATAQSQAGNRFLEKKYRAEVMHALSAWPERAPITMEVQVIECLADALLAARELRKGRHFSYDVETAGLIGAEYFEVLCVATAPEDAESVFVWPSAMLKDKGVRAVMQGLMVDGDLPKSGHNLKYDWKSAAYDLGLVDEVTGEIKMRGVHADTLLWCRSLDSEMKARLEYAAELVGMGGHKQENAEAIDRAVSLIGEARAKPNQPMLKHRRQPALLHAVKYPTTKPKTYAFGLVPKDVLFRYCALDTVATARLVNLLEPVIRADASKTLCTDLFYRPSTSALAQIELWGMSADADACRMASRMLHHERDSAELKIRAAGCTIENLNSNPQLTKYLYEDLKLPVLATTDSGNPAVDAPTLEKLKGKHAVIEHLLNRAKVNTLIGTYADGLVPHIRGGRIRTTIKQDGTRSGRFSSADPNLQNIPSGGKWAKMIKNIFNAPPGHALIQLDYSQLELRIAAMLTGDPVMMQIYKDGVDLHRRTAELICGPMWGLEPHQLNDEDHRRPAKTFNFGLWYGKGDATIADDLQITLQRAAMLRELVLGNFVVAARWIEERRAYTAKHGTTWTYWDGQQAHCRQLPGMGSPDSYVQSKAKNGSFNTPVQGTAAHFMERTIVSAVDWILSDGIPAKITNTVHDSIIVEAPFAWVLEVVQTVKSIMEGWPSGEVPVTADADIGLSWGALMKFEKVLAAGAAANGGLTIDEICHVLEFVDKDTGSLQHDKAHAHVQMAKYIGVAA